MSLGDMEQSVGTEAPNARAASSVVARPGVPRVGRREVLRSVVEAVLTARLQIQKEKTARLVPRGFSLAR